MWIGHMHHTCQYTSTHRAIGTLEMNKSLPQGLAWIVENALRQSLLGFCPKCWPELLDERVRQCIIKHSTQGDRKTPNLTNKRGVEMHLRNKKMPLKQYQYTLPALCILLTSCMTCTFSIAIKQENLIVDKNSFLWKCYTFLYRPAQGCQK